MSEEVKQFTEADIVSQLKPLSDNAFLRFFQKIWRWWLGVWYGFCDKKPKLSAFLYKVFFFIVFSQGVTIYQMLVLIFLPYMFGTGLAGVDFMWPKLPITVGDFTYNWNILGYDIVYNELGEVIVGGGLGYFIAFELAVFTAQCINFPLQRNITYRSHGNPWYQAMWYFIGWLLVSVFCNMINGLWLPLAAKYMPMAVYSILAMIAQGGIAMVIFFFIFMIIFPDNDKMAKGARAKYEKLVAANAPADKIEKAKAKMQLWEEKAAKSNAEKEFFKAKSQVNSKVMSYLAMKNKGEKAETEEEKKLYAEKAEKNFESAVEAIKLRDEKQEAFNAVNAPANA